MEIRRLCEDEVVFTLDIEPEIQFVGDCVEDQEYKEKLLARLDRDDTSA